MGSRMDEGCRQSGRDFSQDWFYADVVLTDTKPGAPRRGQPACAEFRVPRASRNERWRSPG